MRATALLLRTRTAALRTRTVMMKAHPKNPRNRTRILIAQAARLHPVLGIPQIQMIRIAAVAATAMATIVTEDGIYAFDTPRTAQFGS